VARPNKSNLPAGLRRLPDGQILLDLWYKDELGQRRRWQKLLGPVPVAVARDALAAARMSLIQGRTGAGTVGGISLDGAFARYLEWAEQHRPSSLRFRRAARKRLVEHFGHVPLRNLTPAAIEKYKRKRAGEVAPATVNLDLACIKHMLRLCATWGLASREQAHAVRDDVELLDADNERERFLTQDEQLRLFTACSGSPPFLRLVVAAANCGQRSGDIRGLTWDRVDLKAGVVLFTRSKARKGSLARRGLIQVNASFRAVLEDALAERQAGDPPNVFLTRHRKPWTNNTVNREWLKACANARLEDLRFHDLRHHFASILVQRGVQLQRVGAMLGHTRITTTQRYAHLAPGADQSTHLLDSDDTEE